MKLASVIVKNAEKVALGDALRPVSEAKMILDSGEEGRRKRSVDD